MAEVEISGIKSIYGVYNNPSVGASVSVNIPSGYVVISAEAVGQSGTGPFRVQYTGITNTDPGLESEIRINGTNDVPQNEQCYWSAVIGKVV